MNVSHCNLINFIKVQNLKRGTHQKRVTSQKKTEYSTFAICARLHDLRSAEVFGLCAFLSEAFVDYLSSPSEAFHVRFKSALFWMVFLFASPFTFRTRRTPGLPPQSSIPLRHHWDGNTQSWDHFHSTRTILQLPSCLLLHNEGDFSAFASPESLFQLSLQFHVDPNSFVLFHGPSLVSSCVRDHHFSSWTTSPLNVDHRTSCRTSLFWIPWHWLFFHFISLRGRHFLKWFFPNAIKTPH